MHDLQIPDLTFPMVEYGIRETPMDFRVLLYRGAAATPYRTVFGKIASGHYGPPIVERLPLVQRAHEVVTARLVAGGAKPSALHAFGLLRDFVSWAEDANQSLSLEDAEATFRHWSDFLLNRVRLKEIKNNSAYGMAIGVSSVLDDALERSQSLILTTRLKRIKRGARAAGITADKQNLSDTFAFGRFCLDVIESTSFDAVFGPLPLLVRLRSGAVLEQWSGLRDPKTLTISKPSYKNTSNVQNSARRRSDWESDKTLRTRYRLINLRIEAEMFVFIAQTGMNIAQAHKLRKAQFCYKSTIDGYDVRDYKHRKQGAILFEIYSEYRAHFERYLAWRDRVFADQPNDYLFPLIRQQGANKFQPNYNYRLIELGRLADVPFVGPQKLRKTRINWLLRKSRDLDLTAEQAQHTKATLIRIYETPSLQVAQVEIIQFWKKNDPRLTSHAVPCPAPGVCDGKPLTIEGLPAEAPKPDCMQPAGCLFCSHHRDIDSEDYVWSTASMRHLNSVILSGFRPPKKGVGGNSARHIELTMDVLTSKLKWFSESNETRKSWVAEAVARIAESDFHPHWRYLIDSADGV